MPGTTTSAHNHQYLHHRLTITSFNAQCRVMIDHVIKVIFNENPLKMTLRSRDHHMTLSINTGDCERVV